MRKAGEQAGVVRVVVVSPADVAQERAAAQTVVDELNRGVAVDRGCRLSLWRWEADARSGLHLEGPQGLIDELMDIECADVVVGVFWRRFGTPTGTTVSGTEHELRRAWGAWRERGRPEVMIYFCARAYAPKTPDELAQWQRVLEFQRGMPREQLSWGYESVGEFEALLREHLTRYLLTTIPAPAPLPAQATARRVRFNLPAIAASFTGREAELDALDDAWRVADRVVVTQSITGLGGVGKSQLAARYVQQRTDCYDVVAWIRAEGGGIADLAQLAAKLGEPVDGLSPTEAARLALDWLSDSEQRWLLVLDNVESPEQVDGLRPEPGSGRVLVTSRDRALRQFGPVLTVDVFDENTATAYLTNRADRPGDEHAARRLALALGCLPLALSHAAAYCQSGTSFSDYLELLGELPADDLFNRHPEVSYAQTVASTWKASIQAASTDAPLAADVLEMAAHLGPDAIPKSLFLVLVEADTAIGRKGLADALNALARFSLATVDDENVSVHRLLQKVVRDDAAARDDQTAALRALAALHDAFPEEVRLPMCWPWCEQLLPHGLALADALERPGDAGPQLIDLLNRACGYLDHAEPGRRNLATAKITLRHAERVLGAEHPRTLTTRQHLATAYLRIERIEEAIAIYEPLLAERQRILGVEHPDTLFTRNSVAVAYHDAGRVGEAIAIFEPLLVQRERILGVEHPDTLSARHNLGFAYLAAGRIGEAIAIYEPLVGERERVLGVEHPDTLWTLNNLANAYKDAGRTSEAIAILEPLLGDRQRVLGIEHPDTFRTRDNLGRAYLDAGRVGEAIAIFESLLGERERVLGIEHPDTFRTRDNLGRAYLDAGRVGEAIAIFESLLGERERILGAAHPATLTSRHNLAHAYEKAERTSEAVALYEALLGDTERTLGAEHPDTLRTRSKLADAYQALGRTADAALVLKWAGHASS